MAIVSYTLEEIKKMRRRTGRGIARLSGLL